MFNSGNWKSHHLEKMPHLPIMWHHFAPRWNGHDAQPESELASEPLGSRGAHNSRWCQWSEPQASMASPRPPGPPWASMNWSSAGEVANIYIYVCIYNVVSCHCNQKYAGQLGGNEQSTSMRRNSATKRKLSQRRTPKVGKRPSEASSSSDPVHVHVGLRSRGGKRLVPSMPRYA